MVQYLYTSFIIWYAEKMIDMIFFLVSASFVAIPLASFSVKEN